MGKLWEDWLSPGDRKCIEEAMSIQGRGKNMAEFLGAIHDIGKCTPEFQVKRGFTCSQDLDQVLVERLEEAGLEELMDFQDLFRNENPHALAGEALLDSFGLGKDIHSLVGGHHGKPLDSPWNYREQMDKYPESYYQSDDPEDPIYGLWEKSQKEILDWALEASGFSRLEDLPKIGEKGQVLLNGLLIMGDWIASNERYFPLFDLDEEVLDREGRLERAWKVWKKTSNWKPGPIKDVDRYFEDRFGFKGRDAQIAFLNILLKTQDPGIFIFEAPMGMGKTEAALAGAEILAEKTGRTGLFFGLPTQATSNGMFPRIKKWLDKVAKEGGSQQGLRLIHGKSSLNKEFASLPEASQINMDGEREATVVVNRWFSGRKTSNLENFVVATVDQCLLMALKQRHLALRHLGFSRKVVIIDEVHAYAAYMSVYLREALKWLGSYGVPVILLSATLPVKTRKSLLMAYAQGKEGEGVTYDEEALSSIDYPLMTYMDGQRILKASIDHREKEKSVEVEKIPDEEIFPLLEEFMAKPGVVGLMVNTVKKAQALAEECIQRFGPHKVLLLHAAFIAMDRIKREEDLLKVLGKNGKRPESLLVIGTQVIEQSLDIDFDVLISDLAPMDLLIQRMGRLHRHERSHPDQFKDPKLYLLGTSDDLDFDRGSEAIYGGYLLARTQGFLPETIRMPVDISPLVQKVYGEIPLNLPKGLEVKYKVLEEEEEKNLKKKQVKAEVYCLRDPKVHYEPGQSLLGWLKTSVNLKSEELAYAQVRDTDETIEVILVKAIEDGYGFVDGEEDLTYQVDDEDVAQALANQTIQLPRVLCKQFNIEKTIEELEAAQDLVAYWSRNPWLKGSLALVLDENLQADLAGFRLQYDKKFGLSYEKISEVSTDE